MATSKAQQARVRKAMAADEKSDAKRGIKQALRFSEDPLDNADRSRVKDESTESGLDPIRTVCRCGRQLWGTPVCAPLYGASIRWLSSRV